jgi:diguanylate cyclase (GGDEF)-like protein
MAMADTALSLYPDIPLTVPAVLAYGPWTRGHIALLGGAAVLPVVIAWLLMIMFIWIARRQRAFANAAGRQPFAFSSTTGKPDRIRAPVSDAGLRDALTGLPTRTVLQQHLQHPNPSSNRHRAALLILGVDGFRAINAAFGHAAGDGLLRQVAGRLRSIAGSEDLVARLEGDEFAVLTGEQDPDQATALARRILQRMQKPFLLDAGEVHITASIGVAVEEKQESHRHKLLTRANLALRHAKETGRNRHRVFEASMEATGVEIELMVGDLRKAIQRRELFLLYQPKLDLGTGRIHGVEALLRWNHPKHGVIPPDQFIPLAEKTGMIGDIGAWTLDEAARQMRNWRDERVVGWNVAINVSVFQLTTPCFFETVCGVLERHDLDPCDLTLEVTESHAMRHPELTLAALRQLAAIGVNLSLDDFGVGHSSLSHLKRLPIRELKVDRSFISDIEHDADDMAIVAAIVSLARATDLKVVAEGVETVGQQTLLAELGCDAIQGYLIGRPSPPDQIAVIARRYEAKQKTFDGSFATG